MGLLTRIAISNGDKVRKDAAVLLITAIERPSIESWHRQLEAEIQKKALGRLTTPLSETESLKRGWPNL
jgi:hypothetical protein